MFWDSVKKSRFVPIVTLIILISTTLLEFIPEAVNGSGKWHDVHGYFWDAILVDAIVGIVVVIFAIISAVALFRFTQVKKQSNVVFSLGLSRRKIFLAKYLGGIAPFAVAVIFSAVVEILADLIAGYTVQFPTIHFALLTVISMIATYVLTFTVVSAAMAFSGNIIEAGVFSVVIALFTDYLYSFFNRMTGIYTHGGGLLYGGEWNFFYPFFALGFLPGGEGDIASEMLRWVYYDISRFGIYDWSGSIMCFVYSAIIFAIAYLRFPKRKNEISGYFGKAKGLNEICGAMVGFYAGTTAITVSRADSHSIAVVAFVSFIVSFALAYLIFKFIFSSKRMKEMKRSAKRIVAYAAVFAVTAGIFSTGLFGYSAYVPDVESVKYAEISMEILSPYIMADKELISKSEEIYGYVSQTSVDMLPELDFMDALLGGSERYDCYMPQYVILDDGELEKIIEVHKSLAKEGRLKQDADNVCGYNILISYTLKNGATVSRRYSTMSTESAMKALGLNDLEEFKKDLKEYFYYQSDTTIMANASEYRDGFCLVSKDFKNCRYVDDVDHDLMKAVFDEFNEQSAQQIFFHKPEDELGVIFFPKNIELNVEKDGLSGTVTDTAEKKLVGQKNITNMSLSLSSNKCIVVTKDMKNIIKYLADNNLMQYLKSNVTADDVQKIKFATRAEAVGKKNADMLPLFTSGYACAQEVEMSEKEREQYNHAFENYVGSSITDKDTIQTVLDNALLYGYNGNDDRVVEVTYNDGSIATYAVNADVYNRLVKN